MKTTLKYLLLCPLIAMLLSTAQAADIDRLAGKWLAEKTNEDGQKFKQILEFKGNKFKFWVQSMDGNTFIYAEGNTKTEKVGDLRVLKFVDIKAGDSETNIEEIYDDRTVVYRLGYKTVTIAMNFESYRDEDPELDLYKKQG